MAGQIGTELIHRENKLAAAVAGYDGIAQAVDDYWAGNY